MLIGTIIGDIVGSRFEFNNYRGKDFELFTEECQVTDDTIMTFAVAKAIMETEKIIKPSINRYNLDSDYYLLLEKMTVKYMQEIGRKYPYCGYGGMFFKWIFSDDPQPYNSFGNGATMRISPAGFAARTVNEARSLAKTVTGVTHNHEEGIKGAEAVAVAIYMARRGFTKAEIREKINSYYYYSLDFALDDIRDSYQFNETCQETVPQAIEAFLESISFEDAIRNAISIGGDSDTLAAITGAIAEAYYGVPKDLKEKAISYLDDELRSIFNDWSEFIGKDGVMGKFKVLTKYIGSISEVKSYGKWITDRENDRTSEKPVLMPYVSYNKLVDSFVTEFYQFSESHPEYRLSNYNSILENNGIKWNNVSMRNANVNVLDEQCILALIMGAIRAERFCNGALLEFFKDGCVLKWLKRLKEIDNSNSKTSLDEIYFIIGGLNGYNTYHMTFGCDSAHLIKMLGYCGPIEKHYSSEEVKLLLDAFEDIHVEHWNSEYINPYVIDGTGWMLAVKYKGHRGTIWSGSNAYPSNWEKLLSFFEIE